MRRFRQASGAAAQPRDLLQHVAIRLLKGVIYKRDDEALWHALRRMDGEVRDHFRTVNLRLEVNEQEGHAYLRSRPGGEGERERSLPRLIPRQPLTYHVSLILGLLRKTLAEFDARSGDETRLVMTSDEIFDLVRVFLPETANEPKQRRAFSGHLGQIRRLGFLRQLKISGPAGQRTFEVERILVEFVNTEWLAALNARLAAHAAERDGTGKEGG